MLSIPKKYTITGSKQKKPRDFVINNLVKSVFFVLDLIFLDSY